MAWVISSPGVSSDLDTQVRLEQLRLSAKQHRRVALPHFLASVVVALVADQMGVSRVFLLGWLAVTGTLQFARYRFVSNIVRDCVPEPELVSRYLLMLAAWLFVMGGVNAIAAIVIFLRPLTPEHMLLSMIMVGNAAGTISIVAGQTRVFGAWALLSGSALSWCWASQGTWEGLAIGGLVAVLFLMLTLNVKDQQRMLIELVSVSNSLSIERDRAESASASKARFFAAASHDLRQPLTALSYHATTIQALAERNGDPILHQVGEGVSRALVESQSLLDSLLEVSRLDAGAVPVRREEVVVAQLAERVAQESQPMAAARGLTLQCAATPEAARCVALTDGALLRRIVQNLVGNALKFTPQGRVELMLYVGAPRGSAANLVIEVRDTGIGIPAEAQTHVFDEFFQVDNAERDRSKGLGLGLSIVKRMTQLIGAGVEFESELGRGTTFRVTLPMTASERVVETSEPIAPPPRAASSTQLGPRRRALFIDDEPEVRSSLTLLLTEKHWDSRAAADAAEALGHLREGFDPDVLLVDFRLRDGADGLDALEQLRTAGCRAPALLITGDTEPARITAARSAGIEVLYKPVSGRQLMERLAAMTG